MATSGDKDAPSHSIESLHPDSPGVERHLQIYQDVISRMANNSVLTKTWCATLVAAIMVLVARTEAPIYLWIAFVPIGFFCYMDTRYLAQERGFRRSYNNFVDKLHSQQLYPSSLFRIMANVSAREHWSTLGSWSVLPFYGGIAAAVVAMFVLMTLCM